MIWAINCFWQQGNALPKRSRMKNPLPAYLAVNLPSCTLTT